MPRVKKKVETDAEDETALSEDNKKYSKRRIANNWAKYERDIDDDISQQIPDDRDFKFLEKTTNSTNFFQLDEEKQWEKNPMTLDHSLFSLNVKQLTAGIACLPLYEILDMDKKFITGDSIDRCDKIAKGNVLRYRQDYPLLEETTKTANIELEQETVPSQDDNHEEIDSENDELEEFLDRVLDN